MAPSERTRREREAQGLPAKVEDPAVLAKVARLVSTATRPADDEKAAS